ncbi:MAG: hypothetical protein SFU98_03655 [Leptospiraceae bacterium]|nr:hypothetical protein [Leptospiraceae bacterium]
MSEDFLLDRLLKSSFKLLTTRVLEWVLYSLALAVILSIVNFLLIQKLASEFIPTIASIKTLNFDENTILPILQLIALKLGSILGLILFSNFMITNIFELVLIQKTDSWIKEKNVEIEAIIQASLSRLLISTILQIFSFLVSILSLLFCILPYFLWGTVTIFLNQIIVIENKNFDAIQENFKLSKKHFITLLLIPIIFSIFIQIGNVFPFYFIKFLGDLGLFAFSGSEFDLLNFLQSPLLLLAIFPTVSFYSIISVLKTILYTNAYYECKNS